MIRLISCHDYNVEQKMTALFLAILFALENEEKNKILSILPTYFTAINILCFPLSYLKRYFAFKIDFP